MDQSASLLSDLEGGAKINQDVCIKSSNEHEIVSNNLNLFTINKVYLFDAYKVKTFINLH